MISLAGETSIKTRPCILQPKVQRHQPFGFLLCDVRLEYPVETEAKPRKYLLQNMTSFPFSQRNSFETRSWQLPFLIVESESDTDVTMHSISKIAIP